MTAYLNKAPHKNVSQKRHANTPLIFSIFSLFLTWVVVVHAIDSTSIHPPAVTPTARVYGPDPASQYTSSSITYNADGTITGPSCNTGDVMTKVHYGSAADAATQAMFYDKTGGGCNQWVNHPATPDTRVYYCDVGCNAGCMSGVVWHPGECCKDSRDPTFGTPYPAGINNSCANLDSVYSGSPATAAWTECVGYAGAWKPASTYLPKGARGGDVNAAVITSVDCLVIKWH